MDVLTTALDGRNPKNAIGKVFNAVAVVAADDSVVDVNIHITGHFVAVLNITTFQVDVVADVDSVAAVIAEEISVHFNDTTAPQIVQMRGDWTLPSDEISAYLAGFQRYGIPFNAVYGPAAPDGIPLPEILTESAVLDAFRQASATAE